MTRGQSCSVHRPATADDLLVFAGDPRMVTSSSSRWLDVLGIRLPIVQAPMAGISSPAMAAAVTENGGLGSLGVGAMTAAKAREAIYQFRALSSGPLNVNVFVHKPAHADS